MEGGAAGEFNKDFLEKVTTEPKTINSSLTDRLEWGTFLEERTGKSELFTVGLY